MKPVTNIRLEPSGSLGARFSITGEDSEGAHYHIWLSADMKPESDIIFKNPKQPAGNHRHLTRKLSQSKGIGKIVAKTLLEAAPGLLPACLAEAEVKAAKEAEQYRAAVAFNRAKAAGPELLTMAQRCERWLWAVEAAEIEACKRQEHSNLLIDLRAVIAKATTGAPA